MLRSVSGCSLRWLLSRLSHKFIRLVGLSLIKHCWWIIKLSIAGVMVDSISRHRKIEGWNCSFNRLADQLMGCNGDSRVVLASCNLQACRSTFGEFHKDTTPYSHEGITFSITFMDVNNFTTYIELICIISILENIL